MRVDEKPSPSLSPRQVFDIEEYAKSSLQQGKSLADLHTELSGRLRDIRRELHALINKRYEDFLGLSTSLTGVDAVVRDIRPSLKALSYQIKSTHEVFAAKLEHIDSRLAYRSAIREKKQMLRLFIDLSQLLDRVYSVLLEAQQMVGEVESLEYIKCLERAAVDLGQIRYFVEKGSEYPFVRMATEKMRDIEKTLYESLQAFLGCQIDKYLTDQNSNTTSLIAHCLRTYSTIEEGEKAEGILRSHLVKPFMLELFTGDESQQLLAGKGMGLDPSLFKGMVSRVLTFVGRVGVPLVRGVSHELTSATYQLESRVFWREISANIINSLPLVFVPGIPDRFHENYLTACYLMDEFICLFASDGVGVQTIDNDLIELTSGECFIEFSRKWQLSAYFSICKKQILDVLESRQDRHSSSRDIDKRQIALSSAPANSRSLSPLSGAGREPLAISDMHESSDGRVAGKKLAKETIDKLKAEHALHTEIAARTIWAIYQCWLPDIYLRPLASQFWQLTLQIVSAYQHTTDERIRQLIRDNATLGGQDAINSHGINGLLEHIHDVFMLKSHLTTYTKTIYSQMVASSEVQLKAANTREHSKPLSATHKSNGIIDSSYRFSNGQGNIVDEQTEELKLAVFEAFVPLEEAVSHALDYMAATIVSTSCNNVSSQVRRATSQFRHTNREPPKLPSQFVAKLFGGLENIEAQIDNLRNSDNDESSSMSKPGADEFTSRSKIILRTAICAGVSQEMAKACSEALATISKTEASLQRLRKTRVYANDTGRNSALADGSHAPDDSLVPIGVDLRSKTPASDNDKIRRQIWLDLMEIGRIIDSYDVHAHEEYTQLVKLIAPLGI